MKPDVLQQMKEIENRRLQIMKQQQEQQQNKSVIIKEGNNPPRQLIMNKL